LGYLGRLLLALLAAAAVAVCIFLERERERRSPCGADTSSKKAHKQFFFLRVGFSSNEAGGAEDKKN
jgi:hypothetical protein